MKLLSNMDKNWKSGASWQSLLQRASLGYLKRLRAAGKRTRHILKTRLLKFLLSYYSVVA